MRTFWYVILKAFPRLKDRFIMLLLKAWDSPTQSIGLACGKDGLQPRLERRTSLDPQERWRYASTQGGRHVVCHDGPTDEEARRPSHWEVRSHARSWFLHDVWRVWIHWAFREQLSWNPRGCELRQQQQLSSSIESRIESATEAELSR